ncbi:hypothetical protein GLA29479_2154 [Lysobacter antibioticus]|nr:hypothetical protein GLA29479_2154 [Lysobacter antibioticus]
MFIDNTPSLGDSDSARRVNFATHRWLADIAGTDSQRGRSDEVTIALAEA